MTVCAVVRNSDNVVVNAIVIEPEDWFLDDCYYVVMDNELRSKCAVGRIWNGTTFVDPKSVGE